MTTVITHCAPSYTDYVPLPTEPAEDYWDDDLDDVDEPSEPPYTYEKGKRPKWMEIYYEHLFLTGRKCKERFRNSKTAKLDAPIPTD